MPVVETQHPPATSTAPFPTPGVVGKDTTIPNNNPPYLVSLSNNDAQIRSEMVSSSTATTITTTTSTDTTLPRPGADKRDSLGLDKNIESTTLPTAIHCPNIHAEGANTAPATTTLLSSVSSTTSISHPTASSSAPTESTLLKQAHHSPSSASTSPISEASSLSIEDVERAASGQGSHHQVDGKPRQHRDSSGFSKRVSTTSDAGDVAGGGSGSSGSGSGSGFGFGAGAGGGRAVTGGGGVGVQNSKRFPSFQGKLALLTAAQRRMSLQDVNAASSGTGNSVSISNAAISIGTSSIGSTALKASSAAPLGAGGSRSITETGQRSQPGSAEAFGAAGGPSYPEKPTIYMYPRKAIIRSSVSLRDLNSSLAHARQIGGSAYVLIPTGTGAGVVGPATSNSTTNTYQSGGSATRLMRKAGGGSQQNISGSGAVHPGTRGWSGSISSSKSMGNVHVGGAFRKPRSNDRVGGSASGSIADSKGSSEGGLAGGVTESNNHAYAEGQSNANNSTSINNIRKRISAPPPGKLPSFPENESAVDLPPLPPLPRKQSNKHIQIGVEHQQQQQQQSEIVDVDDEHHEEADDFVPALRRKSSSISAASRHTSSSSLKRPSDQVVIDENSGGRVVSDSRDQPSSLPSSYSPRDKSSFLRSGAERRDTDAGVEYEEEGGNRFASTDDQDQQTADDSIDEPYFQHQRQQQEPPPAFEPNNRPDSFVSPMIDDIYNNNKEYYEYLMLCQRHSSSNFIHKIDSSEIVWRNQATIVKMIGPYLLGDIIGKGSFGKVKEGLCSETLQRVAVKIINKKRLRKIPNGVENVIREIKLLNRLKHRNIITLIDVFCKVEDPDGNVGVFNWFSTIEDEPISWRLDDGTEVERTVEILKWYLVFEYCPCSLQTLVEQAEGSKLSVSEAHQFFTQLIEGLSYLHSQSVIHRDIKPGNMLITADGILKISDFGIAEQFSMYEGTPMETTAFAGTHQFISPEIAEGAAKFLGTKGGYPFEFNEDNSLLELYERIIAGKYEMPDLIEPECQDLLQGMLQKNPDRRLSVDDILKHPWTQTFFHEHLKPRAPILTYPMPEDGSPTTPNGAIGGGGAAGSHASTPTAPAGKNAMLAAGVAGGGRSSPLRPSSSTSSSHQDGHHHPNNSNFNHLSAASSTQHSSIE
ncbi:Serine/threonine-protein kinase stk11, partial [Quaeritorhiza haematococci]